MHDKIGNPPNIPLWCTMKRNNKHTVCIFFLDMLYAAETWDDKTLAVKHEKSSKG